MNRAAAAFALLAVAAPVMAEDGPWAVASLGSHHFTDEHFNQHNYGAGFEYPTSYRGVRAVGGFYDNSVNRTSVYAGATWLPVAFGPGLVKVGLIGGVITGYSHPVLPLVLPTMQIEHDRVGFNVYYAPKVKDGANVLGFQMKVKFK